MNSLESVRRHVWEAIYNENFDKNIWGQVYDIVKEDADKGSIEFVSSHIHATVCRDNQRAVIAVLNYMSNHEF